MCGADNCTSTTAVAAEAASNSTVDVGRHLLPVYARVLLIVLYLAVVIVSVGGNTLVIVVIAAQRRMRTVTNCFIVNLAFADTMMATVCVPFTFVADILLQRWPFGSALCPLIGYVQAVAVFLGAFTLVAISVDRHRAIRHPLRARLTARQLAGTFVLIWTSALTLPVPVAAVSRVASVPQSSDAGDGGAAAAAFQYCKEEWPSASLRYWYTLTIMLAQYFLPLGVMSATYSSIAYVVWLKRQQLVDRLLQSANTRHPSSESRLNPVRLLIYWLKRQVPGEAVGPRDHKIATAKKKV